MDEEDRGATGVLKVSVVGTDPEQRRRLVQILSELSGLQVTDDGESLSARALIDCTSHTVSSGSTAPRPDLSPRQREVLVAYASGSDLLPVVARRLGMDEETFKTHLRRLRVKYRLAGRPAPTRRDLYVRAVEDALIPPPS